MSDDHVTLPDDEQEPPAAEEAAETPTGDTVEPAVPACSECGHALEADQAYCLECGAPTPKAPKLHARIGPAGILAIGLLALGIGAGALAYAVSKDDKKTASTGTGVTNTGSVPVLPTGPTTTFDPGNTTPTLPTVPTDPTFPTSPTETTTPTQPTTPTDPTTPTQPTTPTEPTTPTTPTTTPDEIVDTWPQGKTGWTVILATSTDATVAAAFRDKVQATGKPAGLLETSLYVDLEPDFWSVFSGVYDNREAAIAAAERLRATYSDAYAARVEAA